MSELTGFDVEAVLRMHLGDGSDDCAECCACATVDEYVAHVAAVLRVEIDRALGDAWDAGYARGFGQPLVHLDDLDGHRTNPYRPTLAAGAQTDRPDTEQHNDTLAATERDRQ